MTTMSTMNKKLIDLYPYRLHKLQPEFLLFRRAKGKIYEGQWRMIGGKVREDETYWEAALRELKEETGLVPNLFWTIPSVNSFYEHNTDQIHQIPAFAAELKPDAQISLNQEHIEYEWAEIENAISFIRWPEQKRLLQLTHNIVNSNQILEDWLINIS